MKNVNVVVPQRTHAHTGIKNAIATTEIKHGGVWRYRKGRIRGLSHTGKVEMLWNLNFAPSMTCISMKFV